MGALLRRFRKDHAIVGEDCDRNAPNAREAADERRAVKRLELVQLRTINETTDHFSYVVGCAHVGRYDSVQIRYIEQRWTHLDKLNIDRLRVIQRRDHVADDRSEERR